LKIFDFILENIPTFTNSKRSSYAAAISGNDKISIKNRFRNLDLKSPYSIVFSARKGLETDIFYDFAEAVKMPEKNLSNIINLCQNGE
jgi:hypothetical protein